MSDSLHANGGNIPAYIPGHRIGLPPELKGVPSTTLEQYVQQRILQFAAAFSTVLTDSPVPERKLLKAVKDTFQILERRGNSGPPARSPAVARNAQLVFRHDCMALGCTLPNCPLCQHNPQRRCHTSFDRKYLVSEVLKAKCGAHIQAEVCDLETSKRLSDLSSDSVLLDLVVVDAQQYRKKFAEGTTLPHTNEMLAGCMLEKNKLQAPLLAHRGGQHSPQGHVLIHLIDGLAMLPEVSITDSSEALLSGRKPPFRLLLRALDPHTHAPIPYIRPALSDEFVVATKRAGIDRKADVPLIDDSVKKLEHMGKETVKKLANLADACKDVNMPRETLPLSSVETVGQFLELAKWVELDYKQLPRLLRLLKLTQEKWEEAYAHASKAILRDNRMRMWFPPTQANDMEQCGVLFLCTEGRIHLTDPCIGFVMDKRKMEGKLHITMREQATPDQRTLMDSLQVQAEKHWRLASHPGWQILPYDSSTYMHSGEFGQPVNLTSPLTQPAGSAPEGAPTTQAPNNAGEAGNVAADAPQTTMHAAYTQPLPGHAAPSSNAPDDLMRPHVYDTRDVSFVNNSNNNTGGTLRYQADQAAANPLQHHDAYRKRTADHDAMTASVLPTDDLPPLKRPAPAWAAQSSRTPVSADPIISPFEEHRNPVALLPSAPPLITSDGPSGLHAPSLPSLPAFDNDSLMKTFKDGSALSDGILKPNASLGSLFGSLGNQPSWLQTLTTSSAPAADNLLTLGPQGADKQTNSLGSLGSLSLLGSFTQGIAPVSSTFTLGFPSLQGLPSLQTSVCLQQNDRVSELARSATTGDKDINVPLHVKATSR